MTDDERESILDAMVSGARIAYPAPQLCLQTRVLLEILLARFLPSPRFSLKLGALHVLTDEPIGSRYFDPRGPEGVDGGFHAWLEDEQGTLLDPSILLTLAEEGYPIRSRGYLTVEGRLMLLDGLHFIYEPVPELVLVGVDKSEEHLRRATRLALAGDGHPFMLGHCYLDVVRSNPALPRRPRSSRPPASGAALVRD